MRLQLSTLALFLGLATAASAQDGGKIPWRGKTDDPKAAMADAKRTGQPMMIFFTSVGSGPCKQLSTGAFSDPAVLKAAGNFTCIFVECNWGKANVDLIERYGIAGYPAVLFCDPDGKPIGQLQSGDPAVVAKQMQDTLLRPKAPAPAAAVEEPKAVSGLTIANAILAGRRLRKPIALVFYDDSPGSISVHGALSDDLLKDTLRNFVLAVAQYRKGSEEANRFDVNRAPTVLILNPLLAKMEEKPLAKIEGSRSARELQRDLEAALLLGVSEGGDGKAASGKDAAPAEKLSDDEIEAKFIKARISAAVELVKRGKKANAIETLEDIIKSYPKHVESVTAKKLLEELRK